MKKEDLPKKIAIFPLSNFIIFPKTSVPLNIFEPRYIEMINDSMRTNKLIGMVQPKEKVLKNSEIKNPNLYQIGCAGRVTAFSETNDNRYELILKGVCRFKINKEKKIVNGFRSADVSWDLFKKDYEVDNLSDLNKRHDFEALLKVFLKKISISADWEMVETTSDEDLVNMISMCSPFDVSEKQALLEAKTLDKRLEVLTSLMQMSLNDNKMASSANPS